MIGLATGPEAIALERRWRRGTGLPLSVTFLIVSNILSLLVGVCFNFKPFRPRLDKVQLDPCTPFHAGERPAIFLLGIFSVDSELHRRHLIRKTYLSYSTLTCSLRSFLLTDIDTTRCRIVYSFVIGARTEGGSTRYNPSSAEGIALDVPDKNGEGDLVYLNIKENMNEGKTPTWFQYAADISERHGIDYISKLDSDTYVDLHALISLMDADLPAKPATEPDNRKRYGGILREYNTCGGYPYCKLLQGRAYMSGQFYFVSSDLARFVSGGREDEKALGVGHEDFDFGMWIFSYPGAINLVILSTSMICVHSSETKQDAWWQNLTDVSLSLRGSRNLELAAIDDCLSLRKGDWRACV